MVQGISGPTLHHFSRARDIPEGGKAQNAQLRAGGPIYIGLLKDRLIRRACIASRELRTG